MQCGHEGISKSKHGSFRIIMSTKKFIALFWFFVLQCYGMKPVKEIPLNISDRMLNLNLNEKYSDESSSTVVAIDPVKSFLLWTIVEAIALGFITTAALGSIHNHRHKHPSHFYHYPYVPHSKFYDGFEEARQEISSVEEGFPVLRDLLWPSDTKLFFKFLPVNITKDSVPCEVNSSRIMDINVSEKTIT